MSCSAPEGNMERSTGNSMRERVTFSLPPRTDPYVAIGTSSEPGTTIALSFEGPEDPLLRSHSLLEPGEGENVPYHIIPSTDKIKNDNDERDFFRKADGFCRICLFGLVGPGVFNIEGDCKGELELVHRECAEKLFSFLGQKTCDVCSEGHNVDGTLVRVADPSKDKGTINMYFMFTMIAYHAFFLQILPRREFLAPVVDVILIIVGLIAFKISIWIGGKFCLSYGLKQMLLVFMLSRVFSEILGLGAYKTLMFSVLVGFGVPTVYALITRKKPRPSERSTSQAAANRRQFSETDLLMIDRESGNIKLRFCSCSLSG